MYAHYIYIQLIIIVILTDFIKYVSHGQLLDVS